jgi:hypothetical protein
MTNRTGSNGRVQVSTRVVWKTRTTKTLDARTPSVERYTRVSPASLFCEVNLEHAPYFGSEFFRIIVKRSQFTCLIGAAGLMRSLRHHEIEPRRSISTQRAGVRRWLRPGPMILRARTRREQPDQGSWH